MASCDECGYDYDSLDHGRILLAVTSLAYEHRLILSSAPVPRLRDHTRPASWSPLEYGCHVRDMLRIQRDRVLLAQAVDTPRFTSMRREERAIEEGYNDQDPVLVGDEIVAGAGGLTRTLRTLDEAGWLRAGVYPWPAPEIRTVEWIGRRTAHELAHHLFDNRRLLAQQVQRGS